MLRSTKQGETVSLLVTRQEEPFLPRELVSLSVSQLVSLSLSWSVCPPVCLISVHFWVCFSLSFSLPYLKSICLSISLIISLIPCFVTLSLPFSQFFKKSPTFYSWSWWHRHSYFILEERTHTHPWPPSVDSAAGRKSLWTASCLTGSGRVLWCSTFPTCWCKCLVPECVFSPSPPLSFHFTPPSRSSGSECSIPSLCLCLSAVHLHRTVSTSNTRGR